jgi:hypothetical protein
MWSKNRIYCVAIAHVSCTASAVATVLEVVILSRTGRLFETLRKGCRAWIRAFQKTNPTQWKEFFARA